MSKQYAVINGDVMISGQYIYCVVETGCEESGPCKIGVAYNPSKRLCSLQGGNWRKLKIAWVVKVWGREHALGLESTCLARHRPDPYSIRETRKRLPSEWVASKPEAVLSDLLGILRRAEFVVNEVAA